MHAAYNIQICVSKGIICAFIVTQSRSDINDFIPIMERVRDNLVTQPKRVCADAGYGSLTNYKYLEEHQIENYVKHQSLGRYNIWKVP